MRNRTPIRSLLCLIAVALLSGCGGTDRPDTIEVSGIVTFDGGPPPAVGSVNFASDQPYEGYPGRPASAQFDANGEFTVSAFTGTPGLVPGKYTIRIECWKTMPTMETAGESHIPAAANNSFSLDITPESDEQYLELDIVTGS